VIKRLGFACKWLDDPSETAHMKIKARNRELNTGTTTVAWLNRQSREAAEQRLWDLMIHNIEACHQLVKRVGSLDPQLRMLRLGSDILPVFTEPTWRYFWSLPDVRQHCETALAAMGDTARALDVRLSMHPGPFVVLASDRPDVVERSIDEFEYHASMARWMGYGKAWQDFKINVHIAGKAGPAGIRAAYGRLSPEARNCITIENDENSWGLDDCLALVDLCPIVLDIHHHWIREGQYISPSDDRVARVRHSWRDCRPVLHYSVSREDCLTDHDCTVMPDMSQLLAQGHKKARLRAHSDFYWNSAVNDWALSFLDDFDIMCESKAKNLASQRLFAQHRAAATS
jgi:UV DNA damage endonuclease